MRTPPLLSALLVSLLLVSLGTARADAAIRRIDDPAGDGLKGTALDITSVRVVNAPHAIRLKVSFVRAAHGDLGVYVRARGDRPRDGVRVLSSHRSRHTVNRVDTAEGRQRCRGLRIRWDHAADVARVRLPARCFHGGDYEDVRLRTITEIGSDADLAPSTPSGHWPWSAYVARG